MSKFMDKPSPIVEKWNQLDLSSSLRLPYRIEETMRQAEPKPCDDMFQVQLGDLLLAGFLLLSRLGPRQGSHHGEAERKNSDGYLEFHEYYGSVFDGVGSSMQKSCFSPRIRRRFPTKARELLTASPSWL